MWGGWGLDYFHHSCYQVETNSQSTMPSFIIIIFYPYIHFFTGDTPRMDLLYLIKYTWSDGWDHTLKLIDRLAPFWKRMDYLLGITTDQLNTWELMYGNPSSCFEAVLSHFLQNRSQGTYIYPQTWGGVVKLLQNLDLKNIAKEIQSIARWKELVSHVTWQYYHLKVLLHK